MGFVQLPRGNLPFSGGNSLNIIYLLTFPSLANRNNWRIRLRATRPRRCDSRPDLIVQVVQAVQLIQFIICVHPFGAAFPRRYLLDLRGKSFISAGVYSPLGLSSSNDWFDSGSIGSTRGVFIQLRGHLFNSGGPGGRVVVDHPPRGNPRCIHSTQGVLFNSGGGEGA